LVSFGTDCTCLVQFVCSSSSPSGVNGSSPVASRAFVCPADMDPVNVIVTLGPEPAFPGACCENEAAPGTVTITE
jgi:hypothetical protein